MSKGGDQRKIKYPETKDPLLDCSPIEGGGKERPQLELEQFPRSSGEGETTKASLSKGLGKGSAESECFLIPGPSPYFAKGCDEFSVRDGEWWDGEKNCGNLRLLL